MCYVMLCYVIVIIVSHGHGQLRPNTKLLPTSWSCVIFTASPMLWPIHSDMLSNHRIWSAWTPQIIADHRRSPKNDRRSPVLDLSEHCITADEWFGLGFGLGLGLGDLWCSDRSSTGDLRSFLDDLRWYVPRAGSGVVRIDLLRFLAGCCTRRLNQV